MAIRSTPRGPAGLAPILAILVASLGSMSGSARGQEATPVASARAADSAAIREVDAAFARAFDAGDLATIVSLYADDAEVTEVDGDRLIGRDAIRESYEATFRDAPGSKIAIAVESLRFVTAEVVEAKGRAVVTRPGGATAATRFEVLYARRGGRWLIASEREEADEATSPHDRLAELGWLVGDWLDEGPDATVKFSCRWSEDGNFLFRSFTVRRRGQPVLDGTQRIGWDPIARRFRSWEFDSVGGFGEGAWSRDGEAWVVKSTGVRPEGTTASSTNRVDRDGPDRLKWTATDRVLGDESVPEALAYVLVRVPPPPGSGPRPKDPAVVPATEKTVDPSRSPR